MVETLLDALLALSLLTVSKVSRHRLVGELGHADNVAGKGLDPPYDGQKPVKPIRTGHIRPLRWRVTAKGVPLCYGSE
jgi:hypothetical protein